eukprot:TRINITY_DN713_c0_g2_i1.p1 TRINITY_DN713_c0_g2~~TRINITY_DN713_c0_g2_i1.p1  ORF type:complete len:853 (-),score=263.81 TRINITY_DN713_c0_g2_i1:663-3221(-)
MFAALKDAASTAITAAQGKPQVKIEDIKSYLGGLRRKCGSKVLVMAIKDQNIPGKLYMSGGVTPDLVQQITACLQADPNNKKVVEQKDDYDQYYDVVWRNTSLTSGAAMFSMAKPYFPRGKILVQILDLMAKHGWLLSSCPCFGGVEARDDHGNVTSSVEWPVFVFYKAPHEAYTPRHLFLAVKDNNMPGKLCMAGDVRIEKDLFSLLQSRCFPNIENKKDKYDDDYDVVFRNTAITSGATVLSMEKPYFPRGGVMGHLLQCLYMQGWRAVGAPNFGGSDSTWPCIIFRQLRELPSKVPQTVFVSIKDANVPGKVCISGAGAQPLHDALLIYMKNINSAVESTKDSYDKDQDYVLHGTQVTGGMMSFCSYFPIGEAVMTILSAASSVGFTMDACPVWGGMMASWTSFIFSTDPHPAPQIFMAVKDDNFPGKVDLTGGPMPSNMQLRNELLDCMRNCCNKDCQLQHDAFDGSYPVCLHGTSLTTGSSFLSMSKPFFPHGFVVEALLLVLYKHGFQTVGGPNFGNNGDTWPCMAFTTIEADTNKANWQALQAEQEKKEREEAAAKAKQEQEEKKKKELELKKKKELELKKKKEAELKKKKAAEAAAAADGKGKSKDPAKKDESAETEVEEKPEKEGKGKREKAAEKGGKGDKGTGKDQGKSKGKGKSKDAAKKEESVDTPKAQTQVEEKPEEDGKGKREKASGKGGKKGRGGSGGKSGKKGKEAVSVDGILVEAEGEGDGEADKGKEDLRQDAMDTICAALEDGRLDATLGEVLQTAQPTKFAAEEEDIALKKAQLQQLEADLRKAEAELEEAKRQQKLQQEEELRRRSSFFSCCVAPVKAADSEGDAHAGLIQ